MNARQWRRLRRRSLTAAHEAIEALGAAGQRLAERLAYRPREVVVVALLAAGVFGGLAVERWRSRHPGARRASSRRSPRGPRPRCRRRPGRGHDHAASRRAASNRVLANVIGERAAPRLDLNRATPAELARVAGISWRLAARIVAARDAFEVGAGSGASLDETPPAAEAAPASAGAAGDLPTAVPDPESP